MNVEMLIWISLCKLVAAQISGEFWWLSNKLKKNSAWPSPKFEELSVFDTDESAKITFIDNELYKEKNTEYGLNENVNKNDKLNFKVNFQDESKIMWPTDGNANHSTEKNKQVKYTKQPPKSDEDVLEFKFPDDKKFIGNGYQIKPTLTTDKINNITEKTTKSIISNDTATASSLQDNNKWDSENICTFLKKFDCYRKKGFVYFKRTTYSKKILSEFQSVCCILPLQLNTDATSNIHFIEEPFETNKRRKRSYKEETSQALKQRTALLLRRFGTHVHKTTTPTTVKKVTQKIVTSDNDYVDPYWNIKNTNLKKQHAVYATEDYVEDYVVELPKPGLIGLYSDHTDSSWSFANGNVGQAYDDVNDDDSDEEPDVGYGGGFLDPRLEERLGTATPNQIIFGRPAKLKTETTSSEEVTYNASSHIINYQSNPNFNVLQGFKLLNLVNNKSRIQKNEKKTTTESVSSDSKESVLTGSLENDYDESFEASDQVYKDCGQITKGSAFRKDKKIGETNRYSHPWLGLVTLTKRRQTILCYATIVHPRAAVTTADCVHGRVYPGEMTLIAGAWDLEDEHGEDWQKRMVSVEIHAKYTSGELYNNLAVLYWKRPLRLGASVQPACLADPHVGDDCVFAGWGGYDQDIRSQSRWQRASILTPRTCNERIPSNKRDLLPKDSFCAAVPSRGTVTGVGGPLICTVSGKHAAVGIAVWRDQAVVLAPPRVWTLRTLAELQLH